MFWKTSSQLCRSLVWCCGSSGAGHLLGSTSQSSLEAQRRCTTCPAVQHRQTRGQGCDHQNPPHSASNFVSSFLRRHLTSLGEPPVASRVPAPPKVPPTTSIQVT